MFKVNDTVKINWPKAKRPQWQENEGTIIQILDANNTFTGNECKVHIVRLDNGQELPVETKYLSI